MGDVRAARGHEPGVCGLRCTGRKRNRSTENFALQALMELGATVCTPKSPSCCSCPLKHICAAYQQQQEWDNKQRELQKSAAKEFFSPVSAPSAAGEEERMCVVLPV